MRLNTLPEDRRNRLRTRLMGAGKLRLIEAHNGLSARIAASAAGPDGRGFDGIWLSSLTSTAARGLPDIEVHNLELRVDLVMDVLYATDKPLVVDVDSGGEVGAFACLCQKLDALGVSAAIVEDKRYPKRNSFGGTTPKQLEDREVFSHKIRSAKNLLRSGEFMVIARIEALVAGAGMEEALTRAEAYIAAGADAIMIHSKSPEVGEILEFAEQFRKLVASAGRKVPLVCVPTTYFRATGESLFSGGVDMVIYANHLLRASLAAMREACTSILEADCTVPLEQGIASVREIFEITEYFQAVEAGELNERAASDGAP